MNNIRIESIYYPWLLKRVADERLTDRYSKLFKVLYETRVNLERMNPYDTERCRDGQTLRYLFERAMASYLTGISGREYIEFEDNPCNMLELLVGIASRMEDTIMGSDIQGDRTGQWFWSMMTNLGIGYMSNDKFNVNEYNRCMRMFMTYKYDNEGKGCLFRSSKYTMSQMAEKDIWYQMQAYINDLIHM